MNEEERLLQLRKGFEQLGEEGKYYILGISEALLFAQKTFSNGYSNNDVSKKQKKF